MRRIMILGWTILAMLGGCNDPESQAIQVGEIPIEAQVPAGWEHIDYGKAQQFKNGMSKIAIEDMGPRSLDFDEALPDVLAKLRHDRQRDIASCDTVMIAGHRFMVVDTWDRLSHDHRLRYAFAYQGNRLLVLYTNFGRFEEMESAFDELLNSLRFPETSEQPNATKET